ncbi:hypothetical protein [Nocardioides rubriscoriae]|uniref:hypothetical protein n=1 Tax=Nocardioides rubriscoriae TaxID=642762 RepID=UPI0011DF4083|nr:hypothetical protein [Nocardioides rubriscoriae]
MRRVPVLVVAAVVTLVVVVVGLVVVSGDDDPAPSTAPASSPTPTTPPVVPLSDVDTLTTAVRRGEFCDAVAPEAVEAALGAPATDTTSYGDGQDAPVTGRVRDIAHEFACDWTTRTAAARAWVFASPVTPRFAKELVAGAKREPGCAPVSGAASFGRPTLALLCRTPRGLQASYRGLFGDAWLTCTVAGRLDRAEVAQRADRWCVAVLDAVAR